MLVKKKFKRLKINAGFTTTLNGSLRIKQSEKEYYDTGVKDISPPIFKADPHARVYVDSFQVKKWYQW